MKKRNFTFPLLFVIAILALVLRVFTRPATARQEVSENKPFEALDAYTAEHLARLNIPGAALVIVEGDEIAHLRSFGQARPNGEAPTPQTPFLICSLTKSITAMATMQLVEAGRVELDAPVQRYLPWFRVADPQASTQMTVRHLLNQTSGLPQTPGLIGLTNFDNRPNAMERQVRALSTLELARPVGKEFEYSNLNYNVLGLIIEAASGESYADYIQHHVFDPLEMSHSYTSKAAAQQNGMAIGHRLWFGFPVAAPNPPPVPGSLASGQLISSAEDMGRYLIAHLNDGRYRDVQILSGSGIDELHRPAVEARAMDISLGHHAMGWFVEEHEQTTILTHTGTAPDFYAYMAIIPEQKRGMVLLVNANHVMIDKTIMTEGATNIARQLAGLPPVPLRSASVPWILRALPLVPLLQIAGVAFTLRILRRWRGDPGRRPRGAKLWGLHIALPLLPNLVLAALPLVLLGSGFLNFMRLFMPDFTWISLISGSFALVWLVVRPWLVLSSPRRPGKARVPAGRLGMER
ncbi:MAG: serine hydrolase domain-containing protein [Ardenticatenaceae bacterium]|nr:serine hydrolase domain-containing protein [Ardenticatenaceae bacterium]